MTNIPFNNFQHYTAVFEEYILKPALQFIGLDCEWNTNRPVSLLQVATPTVVMLVRISKLNFAVPRNVRLVLEDPTIYKVWSLLVWMYSTRHYTVIIYSTRYFVFIDYT